MNDCVNWLIMRFGCNLVTCFPYRADKLFWLKPNLLINQALLISWCLITDVAVADGSDYGNEMQMRSGYLKMIFKATAADEGRENRITIQLALNWNEPVRRQQVGVNKDELCKWDVNDLLTYSWIGRRAIGGRLAVLHRRIGNAGQRSAEAATQIGNAATSGPASGVILLTLDLTEPPSCCNYKLELINDENDNNDSNNNNNFRTWWARWRMRSDSWPLLQEKRWSGVTAWFLWPTGVSDLTGGRRSDVLL